MEGAEGAGAPREEPRADGAAVSDSFSQLWTDVMGMLVSFFFLGGEGVPQLMSDLIGSRVTESFLPHLQS